MWKCFYFKVQFESSLKNKSVPSQKIIYSERYAKQWIISAESRIYESQRWNQASESPFDWSVARFDNLVTGSNKWIMCVQYIILRIIVKITQIGVFDTPRMKIEIPKSNKSKNSATSQQK